MRRRAHPSRRPPAIIACLAAGLVLAMAGWTAPAAAQDRQEFMDTRLTFTFGSDDLTARGQDAAAILPGPAIADDPAFNLFYDNLNTRFTSRENLTHLVLYREMPAFADDVTTEAALAVRFNFATLALSDTGSYLRMRWNPFAARPDDGLAVTLFPFNAQRVRIGHLWDTSIGGDEFQRDAPFIYSPGGRITLRRRVGFAWAAFKTTPTATLDTYTFERLPGDTEVVAGLKTQFAALGGGGLDLFDDALRVEASGGWFQRGFAFTDRQRQLAAWAVNARIAYRRNMRLDESIDIQLYTNDPNAPMQLFQMPEYVPGRLGYLFQLEGTFLRTDVVEGADITQESALAGSAQARLQWGYLRVDVTALFRDARYVLANRQSGALPIDFGAGRTTNPERFLAVALDYHFPRPRITLAGSFGVRHLAAIRGSDGLGSYIVVLRPQGQATVLRGREAQLQYAARIRARIDISEMLYVNAWGQYVRDANDSRSRANGATGTTAVFAHTHHWGLGMSASARF